ncbi:MAG: hypothetical protein AAB725_00715 [Patescibacteria group bacterium]
MRILWQVDGNAVAEGVDAFTAVDSVIGYGQHTISVQVTDETEFVRLDPEKLLQQSVAWNVVSYPEPDFNGDDIVNFDDFFHFADSFGQEIKAKRISVESAQ